MVKGAFKRIKILRYFNIVLFLDGVEVCNLFIRNVLFVYVLFVEF